MFEKIKGFLVDDGVFFGLLIIIVAVASFGLGKLSVAQNQLPQSAAVSIATENVVESDVGETGGMVRNFVASKKGTKYHLRSCPGAKQMNEANKIYFSSALEAQSAGYTAASNCPGL